MFRKKLIELDRHYAVERYSQERAEMSVCTLDGWLAKIREPNKWRDRVDNIGGYYSRKNVFLMQGSRTWLASLQSVLTIWSPVDQANCLMNKDL
jgi:hypothetical protein